MKGYTSEFRRQAHVLISLTLMIEPSGIRQGHANKICKAYRDEVIRSMHHIRLVEIVPHCSNIHAIRLYEKIGFIRQTALPNKIRYVDGTFGNEIIMQCTNPNFCEQSLLQYHEYLQKLINDTPSPSLKS
jgi:RimJ/RimL family protein N-acetyltransferase